MRKPLLLALTAAAALTACGVPPSGVIEAGAPASGMIPARPAPAPGAPLATVTLFFLKNGELTPYARRMETTGEPEALVALLLKGPNGTDATTDLPRPGHPPQLKIAENGALSLDLPGEATPLTRRAMLQLICTLTHSPGAAALPDTLQVTGRGWTLTQPRTTCPTTPPTALEALPLPTN